MDSSQLAYFLKIAEMEHMTNAARTLHISQPALSRSIRLLEEELGMRLFDRVGRRLVLNEQGRAFYTAVIEFQQSIEVIHQQSQRNSTITGTLSVKVAVENTLVSQALVEFCLRYPEIRVQQYHASLPLADDNEYDFVIDAYNPLFCEAPKPNCTELRDEPYMLAVHDSSPLARKTPITLSDAQAIPFVLPLPQQSLRAVIAAYCHHVGFQPVIRMETNEYETAYLLVERGSCAALIPSDAPASMYCQHIKRLPLKEQAFRRTIYIERCISADLTPAQQCFLDFMVKQLKTLF